MSLSNTSWKTASAAIIAAISAFLTLVVVPSMDNDPTTIPNTSVFLAQLPALIGLYFARDDDKTSEDVGANKCR